MNTDNAQINATVLALRQEFDLAFAQAPRAEINKLENFLAIRIAGDPYAIRVSEISGLHVDRRIMPLPSPLPELLGVAGFRGQIAAVYDLAAVLGYARAISPRWLILLQSVGKGAPVALAFETFESHFSIAPQHIVAASDEIHTHAAAQTAKTTTHLFDVAHGTEMLRPIIQLSSLLQSIQERADPFIQKRSVQS